MIDFVMIEVWCVNLGRGYGARKFYMNLLRLFSKVSRQVGVVIFQEIDEADAANEHRVLRNHTEDDFAVAAWKTSVPILVARKRAKILRRHVTFAAKGLAKVTPHRVVSEAVTRLIDQDGNYLSDWPRVAFLGTHFPLRRESTLTRWARVHAAMTARVLWHKSRGHIIFYAFDSNKHGTFKRILGDDMLIRERGIDKIFAWMPKGYEVDSVIPLTVDLTIDGHDAIGARVSIRKDA